MVIVAVERLFVEPRERFENVLATLAIIVGEFFADVDVTQSNQHQTWLISYHEHLRLTVAILSAMIDQTTETIGLFGGIDAENLLAPFEVVHVASDLMVSSVERLALSRFELREQFAGILDDVIVAKESLRSEHAASSNGSRVARFDAIFALRFDERVERRGRLVLRQADAFAATQTGEKFVVEQLLGEDDGFITRENRKHCEGRGSEKVLRVGEGR